MLKTAQAFGCLGLAFFILFVMFGALTIFWTSHWKKARSIKYSTASFAVLTVIFVMVCVFLYKNEKETSNRTLSVGWYLALTAATIAAIVTPFYFIDAHRTVAPKKSDRKRLSKHISNIPPMPTEGKFPPREPDTFGGNRGRPPLLSELRKLSTTFIHPPPKPRQKKITMKEIESLPLPPSKTQLNSMEKSEIENHPSPMPPPTSACESLVKDDFDHMLPSPPSLNEKIEYNYDTTSTKSTSLGTISLENNEEHSAIPNNTEEQTVKTHSVFKFLKSKTINKGGKTLLKIQNESAKLPPVTIVMEDVDNSDDGIGNDIKSRPTTTTNNLQLHWDQEQARRKFAPFFVDDLQNPFKNDNCDKKQEKGGKKLHSLIGNRGKSAVMNGRVKQISSVYGNKQIVELLKEKPKKKLKRETNSVVSSYSDMVTIQNEIDEEV